MSLRFLTHKTCTSHANSPLKNAPRQKITIVNHSSHFREVPVTKNQFISVHKAFFASEPSSPSNISQSVAPKLLMLGGSDLNMKIVPLEHDTTANVFFNHPPNDSEEDKETATVLGFNSFFLARNSYYSIKFEKKQGMTIEDYAEMTKLDFFSRVPYGTVSTVLLDPDITSHLSPFEFNALFFDKKGRPDAIQRSAEMAIILKSPGGFWNVNCFGSWFTLASQKDHFFSNLLRNLKAELVPQETGSTKPEDKQEIHQALKNAMEQTTTKMKKSKKKIPLNFMQEGQIGVLNLKQEKK